MEVLLTELQQLLTGISIMQVRFLGSRVEFWGFGLSVLFRVHVTISNMPVSLASVYGCCLGLRIGDLYTLVLMLSQTSLQFRL